MKQPPFKILPSVGGSFRRDGKLVTGGRLSWAWEALVTSIACGVPGVHEIRRERGPWYVIEMAVEEAEQLLLAAPSGAGRVRRARALRERRALQIPQKGDGS